MNSSRIVKSLTLALAAVGLGATAIAQTHTNREALLRYAEERGAYAEAKKSEAIIRAKLLNMTVRQEFPNGQIIELMAFEDGFPVYYMTNNANSVISTGANHVQPGGSAGLSLTGSGIVVGEWDGGNIRATHQDLTGRVTNNNNVGTSGHSTHVAGTIMGAGINPAARGFAYQATLQGWDFNNDTSEMAVAAAGGLTLSNHSYGLITGWYQSGANWYWYGTPAISATEDYVFGRYTGSAQSFDTVAFNAPNYLIVKSAGNDRNDGPPSQPINHFEWNGSQWVTVNTNRPNDGGASGYDSMPGDSTAKNILTVAAVNDVAAGYVNPASVSMSSFSSWGPADDGRIKPDISANGVSLTSTYNNSNTAYTALSGTSMAAPSVTGGIALLRQHWNTVRSNAAIRAATMKALVIHTADECGANDGPDYAFGWGLMNVKTAAQVITTSASKPNTIKEVTLSQGQTYSFTVTSNGGVPLKATIAWTDPAGTVPAATVNNRTAILVNDLDLRITGTSGTTLPWKLDPNNPSAAATKADNTVDNVEQVLIPTPSAGTYTISVTHKGTLQGGSQAFSLIVTGEAPDVAGLSLNPATVAGGSTSTGTVTLDSQAPQGGMQVSLSSTNTSVATVASSVTVPAGATTANFTINTTVGSTIRTATIKATFQGTTKQAILTVIPQASLVSLTLNPTTLTGGTPSVGTLTLDTAAPGSGATVTLSSSDVSAATVPATAIVPAGNTTVTFNVTTLAVTGLKTSTIRATYRGVTKQATLTVWPAVYDNAQVVQFVTASQMRRNSVYNVTVIMKNTGNTTWAPGTYVLGTQNPANNSTWGFSSVPLGVSVSPGNTVTFQFSVSSPANPATYKMQWQMKKNATFFGAKTSSINVVVF